MTSTAIQSGTATVAELLAAGAQRLRAPVTARGIDATPGLDAELLLAHALGVGRARLRSHGEEVPAVDAAARFLALIDRRAAGEPVAYILGRKDFWTLELAVSAAVLVPRPETELLVERALTLHPGDEARVADLGTGSGAIALALASARPSWQVLATDISAAALAVARANAVALGLERVEMVQGDWLACLPVRTFDLLLSNPPYVAPEDPALRAPELTREPRLALVAEEDGLAALRAIMQAAPAHLEPGGWLLLEHGAAQAAAVAGALVARGFAQVRSHRDLAGRERMTEGQWPTHR
ncbi:MAG TPA: peptide chain release factor N(5)-glutamine methyltransferase [Steroidobacteraceae bacterium]|jgi:release factor glutamine methyltransferase|nr:peptide chain release factor N(5)-glutamine methyltransferase [Steroidobacteraceae bacterium]